MTANIMRYLFRTGKYELFSASNGLSYDAEETKKLPWVCRGTAPSPEDQRQIASIQDHGQREAESRRANYGDRGIDKIIKELKPDIYWGAEDVWGVDFLSAKPWWNKINPVVHITLDSTPILQSAIDLASKTPNYFVWASFAEREMKKLGFDHVKTLHGPIEGECFRKLPKEERTKLKKKYNVSEEEEIIGFVFRSQLRKSVPNLLEGFKIFREENPNIKAKLLLHTSRDEGWRINDLIQEYGINNDEVLNTHYCRHCKEYDIKPWTGNGIKCRFCGTENSVFTPNITSGVDREQLAEIYNLMTIYCHPHTSGGQEGPLQEAKFCELITLTTNYSSGEDACCDGSGGIPLEWNAYKEGCSQFTKANTCPISIAREIANVCKMSSEDRDLMGKEARKYVVKNYSIEAIGKKIEEIIDSLPFIKWKDSDFEPEPKNPTHIPPQGLSPEDFMLDVFSNIMGENFDKNNTHVKFWTDHLVKSQDYNGVLKHFQNLAAQHNAQQQNKPVELTDLLDKDDEGKRAAIVMPESAGDLILINSLLKKFKALYPEYNLYFFTKPEFFDLVEHREEVHKVLAYSPQIDDMFALTGRWKHRGAFELAFFPHSISQKTMSYQNGPHECRAEWLNSDIMS